MKYYVDITRNNDYVFDNEQEIKGFIHRFETWYKVTLEITKLTMSARLKELMLKSFLIEMIPWKHLKLHQAFKTLCQLGCPKLYINLAF
jgi:hypothetical protein